jgi:hypothetical protein
MSLRYAPTREPPHPTRPQVRNPASGCAFAALPDQVLHIGGMVAMASPKHCCYAPIHNGASGGESLIAFFNGNYSFYLSMALENVATHYDRSAGRWFAGR